MRSIIRNALVLFLVLGVGSWGGCGHEPKEDHSGTQVGQVAPSFSLERVDGGKLTLTDLRGKVVLLDFWDTWCPPCRKALPHLQEISVEHPEGFEVVGVALGQEGPAKVKAFIAKRGFTFPFVQGDAEVFQKFAVQSLPTTFLLDKDGVIRNRWVGGYPQAEYDRAVSALVGN